MFLVLEGEEVDIIDGIGEFTEEGDLLSLQHLLDSLRQYYTSDDLPTTPRALDVHYVTLSYVPTDFVESKGNPAPGASN